MVTIILLCSKSLGRLCLCYNALTGERESLVDFCDDDVDNVVWADCGLLFLLILFVEPLLFILCLPTPLVASLWTVLLVSTILLESLFSMALAASFSFCCAAAT